MPARRQLLKAGTEFAGAKEDVCGEMPLHHAASNGQLAAVEFLLKGAAHSRVSLRRHALEASARGRGSLLRQHKPALHV